MMEKVPNRSSRPYPHFTLGYCIPSSRLHPLLSRMRTMSPFMPFILPWTTPHSSSSAAAPDVTAADTLVPDMKDPCLAGVIEDGVNGWQFQDEADFREKLLCFLKDASLREQMSRSAAELARSRFSSEQFARSVLEVYQQVLRQRKGRSAA